MMGRFYTPYFKKMGATFLTFAAALSMFCATAASAAVLADGTVGTIVAPAGGNYTITGGAIRGGNLFHSFSQFSLSTGNAAIFNGPVVANIISRVTGGLASNIDGTIRSNIAGANLYLLNPAGIVFGPNASLDITGSFHATTADYLKLGTTGRFPADIGGATNLTTDPPSAFGFLNANPASIAVNGSLLTVPEGKSISLVSGGITITNGNLWAYGGTVNLASVASAGEVLYDGVNITPQGFAALGPVTISENRANAAQPTYPVPGVPALPLDMQGLRTANLDASGKGGGKIQIRGGSFYISGGTVYNDTYENVAPQTIDIAVSGNATIDRSSVTGNAMAGTASGAAITISGGTVNVSSSVINTDSQSGANGSNLSLTATDTINISGTSVVSTDANSVGSRAGTISVTAPTVTILSGARVSSSAPVLGATGAGSITLNATQSLNVVGELRSDTFDGASGAITINTGNLNVRDSGLISSALVSNPGVGPRSAGDIAITADNVNMSSNGRIQSNVLFSNSGNAGNISINSQNMKLLSGASISSSNDSVSGPGGNILINNSGVVSVINSEVTTSATKNSGSGKGGNVTVNTAYLVLFNSRITAQASYGDGGNLLLRISKLFIESPESRSLLSASSRYGRDGTVVIQAPNIDVSGALAVPVFDILNLNAFMPKRCMAADELDASTFRLLGSEGLPSAPENSFPTVLPR